MTLGFIIAILCGSASGMMHERDYLLAEKNESRQRTEPRIPLTALSVAFLMIRTPSCKILEEQLNGSRSLPKTVNTLLKHVQKCSWNLANKNPRR